VALRVLRIYAGETLWPYSFEADCRHNKHSQPRRERRPPRLANET